MRTLIIKLTVLTIALTLSACSGGGGGSSLSGGNSSVPIPAAPGVNGSNGGSNPGTQSLAALLLREYATPFSTFSVGATPDGRVWLDNSQQLALLNPSGGIPVYGALAPGESSTNHVTAMATGTDGSLWYALPAASSCSGGNFGYVNNLPEAGGTPTMYTISGPGCYSIRALTVGPDGNVWASASGASGTGAILKFAPGHTSGQVSTYTLSFNPGPITSGPDGALWFIGTSGSFGAGILARIDTSGNVSTIANQSGRISNLTSLASGGGYVWATDQSRNYIARFTTSGSETDYAVPIPKAVNQLGQLAVTGGFVYFTQPYNGIGQSTTGKIGQLSITTGAILEYDAAGCNNLNPQSIGIDPTGNVWVSDSFGIDVQEFAFQQ